MEEDLEYNYVITLPVKTTTDSLIVRLDPGDEK